MYVWGKVDREERCACRCAVVVRDDLRGASINIEWRPAMVGATPDGVVDIQLYVVSDSGFDQSFSAISVLFSWDPGELELLGFVDPCTHDPCPVGTYRWLQSWFPDDSALEGINDDRTDGDAFYQALGQLGLERLPYATAEGLQITTLQFRVIQFGSSLVAFIPEIGVSATRVAGGDLPGLDFTGTIGPPVTVLSRACYPPDVVATGSRYFQVTPAAGTDPVRFGLQARQAGPASSASMAMSSRMVRSVRRLSTAFPVRGRRSA